MRAIALIARMAGSNNNLYGTTFVVEFENMLSIPNALKDVATNS